MSEIPKRCSKVPVYDVGILPIRNIGGLSNFIKVSDICDLPIIHEVGYYRFKMMTVYISLFI